MSDAPRLRLAPMWWAGGLVLCLVIVVGSLEPATELPHTVLLLPDKLQHFLGYFSLALWFSGLVGRARYPVLLAVLLTLGASLEIGQYLMHLGRSAEWLDMFANALGVLIGIACAVAGLAAWPRVLERRFGLG